MCKDKYLLAKLGVIDILGRELNAIASGESMTTAFQKYLDCIATEIVMVVLEQYSPQKRKDR